jgi:hypothetical protein
LTSGGEFSLGPVDIHFSAIARAAPDRRFPRPDEGTARRALIKDRVAARNRQRNLTIARLKRQAARRREQIAKEFAAIDAERDRLVKADFGLADTLLKGQWKWIPKSA